MLQLELLWKLQCIDKEIASVKKDMKNREVYSTLSSIKDDYNTIKEALDKELQEFSINSKTSVRLNLDLKNLDEKVKDSSRKLYDEGSSIKVIDTLQKEIDTNKLKVDDIENQLLKFMESSEDLKSLINERKSTLRQLKREFDSLKKGYTENSEKFKKQLEVLISKRDTIIKEIDEDALKLYNDIALKKMNPVSQVKNEACTECGLKLNAMLHDALRKKNSVCLCDYCGRILYMD